MRHRFCLALVLITAALFPPFARAQGVSGTIEGFPTVSNTATQNWSAAETHFWTMNTSQDPAAVATWSLNVLQSGQVYDLLVFIPAPSLQETQPRTNRALYEIRSPGGGLTQFLLNQAVTTPQWFRVPTSSLAFAQQ